jgi:hypothetical protein
VYTAGFDLSEVVSYKRAMTLWTTLSGFTPAIWQQLIEPLENQLWWESHLQQATSSHEAIHVDKNIPV